MAIPSAIYLVVYAATASFCVTMSYLQWRTYRRYKLINALLLDICMRAFIMQHAPVWRAWCDHTGLDIEILPIPRRGKQKP